MIEVELDGKRATTDGKEWTTEDRYLGTLLRYYANPQAVWGDDIPGYRYVPDMAMAMVYLAKEKIEGLKIITEPEKISPGLVY